MRESDVAGFSAPFFFPRTTYPVYSSFVLEVFFILQYSPLVLSDCCLASGAVSGGSYTALEAGPRPWCSGYEMLYLRPFWHIRIHIIAVPFGSRVGVVAYNARPCWLTVSFARGYHIRHISLPISRWPKTYARSLLTAKIIGSRAAQPLSFSRFFLGFHTPALARNAQCISSLGADFNSLLRPGNTQLFSGRDDLEVQPSREGMLKRSYARGSWFRIWSRTVPLSSSRYPPSFTSTAP